MEDANLHGGWLTAWGRPGLGAQFRLTLTRRLGMVLRTSPLPLVPRDLVSTAGTRAWSTDSRPEPPPKPDVAEGPVLEGEATVPNPSDEAAVSR
jgi:two-component system sensor histidine kinase MtrB